ncbi:MAG: LLM class flavin-dependent oxidoreductase [Rhodospirillaceae bacterium]
MTLYSVLDLAPIPQGTTAGESLRNSLDLAQHAERWGYTRYWLAEHHNFPGIASAATSVVIGHIAGGTSTIRVGSGGVMLPNHSPLVIAEQFGTLESLYPGRIDLGLGRAPGTDQLTWRALRRDPGAADRFPQDVAELQALLGPARPDQRIHAVPGVGTQVPLWILGSSLFGAQLAAHMGLPFAFASHFAPDALMEALDIYRARFKPSAQLDRPYAVVGVGVVAADTDAAAQRIATSVQQAFVGIIRNARTQLPPPVDDMDAIWSAAEKAHVERMLRYTFVGSAETVRAGLAKTIAETGADEIMATGMIFDHVARVRSYEILAQAMHGL